MRRRRRLLLPLPIGERVGGEGAAGFSGRNPLTLPSPPPGRGGVLALTQSLATSLAVIVAIFAAFSFAAAHAADLIRVAMAGAVAFSFVPNQCRQESGISPSIISTLRSPASAATPSVQQAMVADASMSGLAPAPAHGLHRQGRARQGDRRHRRATVIFALVVARTAR